jgi:hypothetical protein
VKLIPTLLIALVSFISAILLSAVFIMEFTSIFRIVSTIIVWELLKYFTRVIEKEYYREDN